MIIVKYWGIKIVYVRKLLIEEGYNIKNVKLILLILWENWMWGRKGNLNKSSNGKSLRGLYSNR